MKVPPILAIILALSSLSLPACNRMNADEKESHQEHQNIVVTTPLAKDVIVTQKYVCQIRARNQTEIRPLQDGYLEAIPIKEGQVVKKGDVLFKILPTLYQARLDAENAEADLARIKFENTEKLFQNKIRVVSDQEVRMARAELDKAKAKAQLAAAEVNFTTITAPFDGIVDRQYLQLGSLVEKKDILTTLSDNRVMWVRFNVPEARYLEYMAARKNNNDPSRLELVNARIELVLADGSKFNHDAGNTVTVEGKFNNETGNIQFRADFPNPDGLLRHGQTGTIVIHRTLHNAIVIPQRATFEILDKRYVWIVGEDHVAHQHPITTEELEDIFIIKSGLDVKDKIILEGGRQVRDGEKVEFEFQKPEEALTHQKFHAE